jgi:hypothetical protein
MDISMEDVENVVGRVQKAAHPDGTLSSESISTSG